MPGLPNYDHEPSSFAHEHLASHVMGTPTPVKMATATMAINSIKYIPPQMDVLAGTTTEASRQNPIRLFLNDAAVLFTVLQYAPWIIIPFRTSDKSCELYVGPSSARDLLLQGWLSVVEITFLVAAIPVIMLLPGIMSVAIAVMCCALIIVLSWPMQGPRIAYSMMDGDTVLSAEQHGSERWLFVNGCATGHAGLQKNIDRLSKTFGRAIIGVHNNTYGLVADLIECLIQRCFSYRTMDVRVTYDYVKACLIDPTVTKVVLIGHSQGGIIISLVLDELFADLPRSAVSKLEIYTFGSAASHFSNPILALSSHPRCIQHIEHYCNEYDMIGRWGVLHSTMSTLDNRYNGSVFVRMGATGHLFNQHYMDPMFPCSARGEDKGEDGFLDKVVDVDMVTAIGREKAATRKLGVFRRESGFGDTSAGMLDRGSRGSESLIGFIPQGAKAVAPDTQGKTVRELSRLWRYRGGASPEEANGV